MNAASTGPRRKMLTPGRNTNDEPNPDHSETRRLASLSLARRRTASGKKLPNAFGMTFAQAA